MKRAGALFLGCVLFTACGGAQPAGSGGTSQTGGQAGGGGAGVASGSGGTDAVGTGGAAGAGAGSPGGGSGSGGSSRTSTAATGGAGAGGKPGSLPEGDQGIAADYPGDVGIANDPAVIFADDFESYGRAADLGKRWDNLYQNQYVGLATAVDSAFAGKQALEFTLPQQTAELSDAVEKKVSPELDVLFLRYYSKFQPPYDVVGSSHNGSSISAHYQVNGQSTPGIPADGTNKFLVNLENWRGESATRSPGDLNVYLYHPLQRSQWGDHFFPTGLVMPNTSIPFDFGPDFVSRPDLVPELDRWYGYELMVKANTPGQKDGRIAAWVDGKLVMDFPNLRLRDMPSLTIDQFALCFHIGSNPNGPSKKWYDNVVAAKSYIGPMRKP